MLRFAPFLHCKGWRCLVRFNQVSTGFISYSSGVQFPCSSHHFGTSPISPTCQQPNRSSILYIGTQRQRRYLISTEKMAQVLPFFIKRARCFFLAQNAFLVYSTNKGLVQRLVCTSQPPPGGSHSATSLGHL